MINSEPAQAESEKLATRRQTTGYEAAAPSVKEVRPLDYYERLADAERFEHYQALVMQVPETDAAEGSETVTASSSPSEVTPRLSVAREDSPEFGAAAPVDPEVSNHSPGEVVQLSNLLSNAGDLKDSQTLAERPDEPPAASTHERGDFVELDTWPETDLHPPVLIQPDIKQASTDRTPELPPELPGLGIPLTPQFNQMAEEHTVDTAPEKAAAAIAQSLELEPQIAEQTETAIEAMPETVQLSLVEFIEQAEPEEALAVEHLVVQIAVAADRLHELAAAEQLEGEEAAQIEQLIGEWYEQLLTKLGIEADEETIKQFIAAICAENYKAYGQAETAEPELVDEGLHERKAFDLSVAVQNLAHLMTAMELEIARLMVRLSTKPAALA